jgi:hypothetical protein
VITIDNFIAEDALKKMSNALDELGIEGHEDIDRVMAILEVKNPPRYGLQQIAWELERTAMGEAHYGNALRVATDIPGVTPGERALLTRYATGKDCGTDHVALQSLAMKVLAMEKPK